jgi:hypothetical protein
MEVNVLAERRAELVSLAERRGVDWQPLVKGLPDEGLPDEDGLMVAALATLLGIDVVQAFDPESSAEQLALRSERVRVEHELRDELSYRSTDLAAAERVSRGITPEEDLGAR